MELITRTKPNLLIADEGKMIRSKNDIYIPAKYDEQGNLIEEEKIPYYSTLIFLADNIDTSKIDELYVEEEIEKE
ncbi:MAG: hypothetical protein SOZ53_01315 [Candidatus Onthovivens sp.]|nr:hypothetical protein [Candidatus Onthovivens sp.]